MDGCCDGLSALFKPPNSALADRAEPEADNVAFCLQKIQASTTDGEAELDQKIPAGVEIRTLPPSHTGFPAWSRIDSYVNTDADRDRGHADWAVPRGTDNSTPRILYCHGGGYEWYSPQDVYRPHTARLAEAAQMPVFCFDYRLVPEFRHPAQLDDGVQALRWLVANGPDGPGRASKILLAGDSAGGGLALALAVYARDNPVSGLDLAGVCVVSPMTDLTCRGESYTSRRWRDGGGDTCDPIFNTADPAADSMDQFYKLLGKPEEEGSLPLTTPSISPLHAELHRLPPTQIHVGDAEVMLSDAVDFGKKAKEAGSPCEVKVWPRMWHVFTQYTEGGGGPDARPLDSALQAVAMMGNFMKTSARC